MNKSNLTIRSKDLFKIVNNAHTNRSVSKQTFSFGKTARFSLPNPTCKRNYYAGDGLKSRKIGVSIGSGSKLDWTKDLAGTPGSPRYELKSQIDENTSKRKGFVLGLGRENIIHGSYINRELSRTPSADKYKINLHNKNKAPIYTMRSKTKQINKTMTIESQNENPGPGSYRNPQIEYKSVANRFSTVSYQVTKSPRFQKEMNNSPGPAAYNQIGNLSKVGKYILSNDKGGTMAKFNHSRRLTKFDEEIKKSKVIPGVGSYEAPSQFGIYDRIII